MGAGTRAGPRHQSVTRFHVVLGAIALAALIFRIAYVVALRHRGIAPDGVFYFYAAASVRQGHGFVNLLNGKQSAQHPPLWTLLLTIPALLGRSSILSAQVFSTFIGVATVVTVGFAGRRIGSERVGLIAAALAAAYPGFWVYEQRLLSETLLLLLVATTVIAAYRYQAGPTRRRAVLLGALCGLLALTRSEQVLLVPVLLFPLMLGWRWSRFSRTRVELLAIACITTVVVIAPWPLYNRGRVGEPVLLTTQTGSAMAQGNCDSTYSGRDLGYFDLNCLKPFIQDAARRGSINPSGDAALRHEALSYIKHHIGRVPLVSIARQGREWSFYKPFQTLESQAQFPQSPWWPQGLYLFFYWALIPAAVLGGVVLRRRSVSLLPLLAPFVVTVVAVAVTYGDPRLRAASEVPLVLVAAVGIERLTHIGSRSGQRDRASSVKNAS
jgi:4-amino-4-deoxy-L-arabinose transferase-like glycosyltransferase